MSAARPPDGEGTPVGAGLLHRLGARAAGTAWAVRSDLRLPFGTAAAGHTPVSMPLDEAPEPGTLPAAAPHREAVRAATMAQDARAAPEAPAHAARPSTPPLPPALQAPAPATQGTVQVAAARRAAAAQRPQPLLAPQAGPATAAPQPASADAAAVLPDHRRATAASRGAPAPLLPMRDAVHGATDVPRLSLRTPGPTAARAAAARGPEVHIHIGRIDVAAAPTAAPAAPKPRARPQPVSLDDYLARKGGAR